MGYIFEPEKLQVIAKRAVGLPFDQMVDAVVSGMAEAYPEYVETKKDFFFSLAGGITGMINVIHGSLSEYVLIFGTPIGSEGYSGRYSIDIYDILLAGEMYTYTESRPGLRVKHVPGEIAYLPKNTAKAASFTHDTAVAAAHRGHRLGLLLKADVMRWLAGAEPQVATVDTWNAASNDHMIAVNERLGYRVMGSCPGYQRRL